MNNDTIQLIIIAIGAWVLLTTFASCDTKQKQAYIDKDIMLKIIEMQGGGEYEK